MHLFKYIVALSKNEEKLRTKQRILGENSEGKKIFTMNVSSEAWLPQFFELVGLFY